MSDERINLSLSDVYSIAKKSLMGVGVSPDNAASVAQSIVSAEAEGTASNGLLFLPTYCEHVKNGKVDGQVTPSTEQVAASAIRVDAKSGFAHPAIDAGFDQLMPLAEENGIAILNVVNSYNCGVLGYHVRQLAKDGLVGIGFTNAPASIAPTGGKVPVIGTNPIAIAVPDEDGEVAMVIDQSASVALRTDILKSEKKGDSLPAGWAQDVDGNPTTDPETALKGSILPYGGYKGFGIGLMVELMAAALGGATLGKDASPFIGDDASPSNTGQCFIAINPNLTSNGQFYAQLDALISAIDDQSGARIPGGRKNILRDKNERDGIWIADSLLARLQAYG